MIYRVTAERLSDNKRFTRSIAAISEEHAVQLAYAMLRQETDDYCILSAVTV